MIGRKKRVLIDIGHPAHAHYFKGLIAGLQRLGHEPFVTCGGRPEARGMLESLQIPFVPRPSAGGGILARLLAIPAIGGFFVSRSLRDKIDLFVSFGSPYVGLAAWLTRKRSICFTDTEHGLQGMLDWLYTETIVSSDYTGSISAHDKLPFAFEELYVYEPGAKEIAMVREALGIGSSQRYVLLRRSAWDGHHDLGERAPSKEFLASIKGRLEGQGLVVVGSDEGSLSLDPSHYHALIAGAHAVVSEGATTAAESFYRGVPVLYLNPQQPGYIKRMIAHGRVSEWTPEFNLEDWIAKASPDRSEAVGGLERQLEVREKLLQETVRVLES